MRIRDFDMADKLLGNNETRRLPGVGTTLVEIDDPVAAADEGAVAVRYHDTDVLVYLPDGSIVYNHGGWVTQTTAGRMNDYGPERIRVRISSGRMFVKSGQGDEVAFEGNAVRVLSDGRVEQLPSFDA